MYSPLCWQRESLALGTTHLYQSCTLTDDKGIIEGRCTAMFEGDSLGDAAHANEGVNYTRDSNVSVHRRSRQYTQHLHRNVHSYGLVYHKCRFDPPAHTSFTNQASQLLCSDENNIQILPFTYDTTLLPHIGA